MRESAAAQLRLWRECMHRYETVARDVGDTDARLMVRYSLVAWKKENSKMSGNNFTVVKHDVIPSF